jgi:putative ABC transport system permease protein
MSFGEQGLVISELDATAEIARSVRLVLTAIVQGFMGIGLAAGVAALGLLGVQSVLERRQQLGMLRALGFRRRDVRATLAWEGSTVGILGISLGTLLGLVLAWSVISIIATANPEVRFDVPWNTIARTMALAVGGAALAIAVAAWQAGRISPAEALRLD